MQVNLRISKGKTGSDHGNPRQERDFPALRGGFGALNEAFHTRNGPFSVPWARTRTIRSRALSEEDIHLVYMPQQPLLPQEHSPSGDGALDTPDRREGSPPTVGGPQPRRGTGVPHAAQAPFSGRSPAPWAMGRRTCPIGERARLLQRASARLGGERAWGDLRCYGIRACPLGRWVRRRRAGGYGLRRPGWPGRHPRGPRRVGHSSSTPG